jgi:hypothetical protein
MVQPKGVFIFSHNNIARGVHRSVEVMLNTIFCERSVAPQFSMYRRGSSRNRWFVHRFV